IAFVDGKSNYRSQRFITAYQRNIRTVEGGDYGNVFAPGGDDFFCHIGSGCVRNGIMYVQQVELMIINHIYHGTGECRFVRGVLEKRISSYAHFMIEYISVEFNQTDRLLIRDEMNLMSFFGQRLSQFSGQNATSTKSRVTNDANSHGSLNL